VHPLAELGLGLAGITIPPAGWTCALVAVPLLVPGFQSVPGTKLRGVGKASLTTRGRLEAVYGVPAAPTGIHTACRPDR
jgi:hypothetical protein